MTIVSTSIDTFPMGHGDQSHAIEEPLATLRVDTTHGSPLHRIEASRRRSGSIAKLYVTAVSITYVPLLVSVLLSPIAPATQTPEVRLPFLYDWNIAFLFLVSFPALVVLLITDQAVLASALHRVQADGVILVDAKASPRLAANWKRRFLFVNVIAYVLGAFVGSLVVYFNYLAYVPESVGYWIATQSRLVLAGYVFCYCIFMFYALISVYVLRTISISLFLRDVVAHSSLEMLPFHPDRCGGLRPVGQLGLRTQYGLTVFGLNVVTLIAISVLYLDVPQSLYGLIAGAAAAYLILGPIVFVAPLLPFRAGMLRTKVKLMSEVAMRLRIELQRLRQQLPAGHISRDDEELIDRLRKIGSIVDELPVWPFDAGTLRKFLAAYVIPFAGAIAYPFAQNFVGKALAWMRP